VTQVPLGTGIQLRENRSDRLGIADHIRPDMYVNGSVVRAASSPRLKLDSRLARAIAALSCGLVHCSAEPTQPAGTIAGAGTAAAGSAGSGADPVPVGGSGPAPIGGSALDGGGAGGSGPTAAGGGGMQLAGSAGAGGTTGGAASSCPDNGFLCDDFEQYAAASEPTGGWTVTKRGEGQIVVDTTRAFSGTKSLHVSGKMNQDRANISQPLETESPLYFRFMMYAASYPASSGVHTRLMRIGTEEAASGNPYTSYSLAAYNGVAIERVNSIYLRDTGTKFNSSNLLNRWVCWEWSVDQSGGMGNVKVKIWVDGGELTLSAAGSSSHGQTSASWDPIDFKIFMLGLDGYQADPEPADLWIDDLSVTPERVGCNIPPP
jgi:hypothetical protein